MNKITGKDLMIIVLLFILIGIIILTQKKRLVERTLEKTRKEACELGFAEWKVTDKTDGDSKFTWLTNGVLTESIKWTDWMEWNKWKTVNRTVDNNTAVDAGTE